MTYRVTRLTLWKDECLPASYHNEIGIAAKVNLLLPGSRLALIVIE